MYAIIIEMSKRYLEWMRQADYDMDTADAMFSSGRYIYAVFMCHLSLEKALKGLYTQQLGQIPPKTHNLVYLLNQIDTQPDAKLLKFIVKLNTTSIATRYPDDLARIQKAYGKGVTQKLIADSKKVLQWIKMQL